MASRSHTLGTNDQVALRTRIAARNGFGLVFYRSFHA